MAKQVINVGSAPDDGTGDLLRDAFIKSNDNFDDLYTQVASKQPSDADLTAIAALSTTSFGRALLELIDENALRTTAGLGTLATQNGTFSGTSSGTNTGDQTAITGNAGSATVLQTARTINGVSFNGSANITINAVDATARVPDTRTINTTAPLTGGGDLSANRTLAISAATTGAAGSMSSADKTKLDAITGTNTGDQTSVTGNAGTATALQTARNFSISGGGISASTVSFNGSAAVILNASVDAGHITLARMANLAANSFIGNNTGSAATPIALTVAQAKTLLAIGTADVSGLGTISTQAASSVAITGGSMLNISAFSWRSASGTADNRLWDLDFGAGNTFTLRAVNDAISAASGVFSVSRSGATVTEFRVPTAFRCNTLRVDVTPTAKTITCTHVAVFSVNGTDYEFPCKTA